MKAALAVISNLQPCHIYVLDRVGGSKVTELDFNGHLTDTQISLLTTLCVAKGAKVSDLVFLKEIQDTRLDSQLAYIEEAMASAMPFVDHNSKVRLTRRETQVLEGLIRGDRNKEIANLLNLAERTVKFHVSSIFTKFNITRRQDLSMHHWQRVRKSGDH